MDALRDDLAQWWHDRWWLTEQYIDTFEERVPHEQIDAAIHAVARVFNQKWANSADAHPVCFFLLSQGTDPLRFLVSLGLDLLAVKECRGFRYVQEDLRDSGSYASARLELSLGALLHEAGHEIEFRPKLANGKESDIVARLNGQEVFLEVKIVRESQVTEALSEFATWLARTVDDSARSLGGRIAEMFSEIHLDPKLADVFGAGLKNDPTFVYRFAEQTRNQIADLMRHGSSDFSIPDVGSFMFRSREVLPNSAIIHHPVSPTVELNRILRPLFHGAIEQLPPNRPGLFVFRTAGNLEEGPTRGEIQRLLHSEAAGASHVSAVIILPTYYSLPSRWSRFEGFAIDNSLARFPASSLLAFRTIVDECKLNQSHANRK